MKCISELPFFVTVYYYNFLMAIINYFVLIITKTPFDVKNDETENHVLFYLILRIFIGFNCGNVFFYEL